MTKEDELMGFLEERVFGPVLDSSTASRELKSGVRMTITRMRERDAAGMVAYVWSAINGTERSVPFADRLLREGFTRFEDVLLEFNNRFDDRWLAS